MEICQVKRDGGVQLRCRCGWRWSVPAAVDVDATPCPSAEPGGTMVVRAAPRHRAMPGRWVGEDNSRALRAGGGPVAFQGKASQNRDSVQRRSGVVSRSIVLGTTTHCSAAGGV